MRAEDMIKMVEDLPLVHRSSLFFRVDENAEWLSQCFLHRHIWRIQKNPVMLLSSILEICPGNEAEAIAYYRQRTN
jgi:hypothetical protein